MDDCRLAIDSGAIRNRAFSIGNRSHPRLDAGCGHSSQETKNCGWRAMTADRWVQIDSGAIRRSAFSIDNRQSAIGLPYA
jgi:hypothetical protein